MRPLLPLGPEPRDRLIGLGQAGQGVESVELQAQARLPRPLRLLEHCHRLTRWITLRFRWPRR